MRYITILWYSFSVMYYKRSLGVSGFQHQTPSLCWPRLGWSDANMHTMNLLCLLLFWTSKEKNVAKPELLNVNCPSLQLSRNRCWYNCLYISQEVIGLCFSCKDQTQDQFTVTLTWASEENCKSGGKFCLPIFAFFFSWMYMQCHSFNLGQPRKSAFKILTVNLTDSTFWPW